MNLKFYILTSKVKIMVLWTEKMLPTGYIHPSDLQIQYVQCFSRIFSVQNTIILTLLVNM